MLELAHKSGGDLLDFMKSTENGRKKVFGQMTSCEEVMQYIGVKNVFVQTIGFLGIK
jgi:hypothetical protein